MLRFIVCVVVTSFLFGCSAKNEVGKQYALETKVIEQSRNSLTKFLAYEHSLTLDTTEANISPAYQSIQKTCQEAVTDACTILSANIESNHRPGATIKFRAKPAGITKIVGSIGKLGEITERSTHAEDLEAPLSDTVKKISMLKDYRSKLEELLNHKGLDADSLIKLTKELAQVQSEIETISGTQATLNQRIETEILTVSIVAHQNLSFWGPIASSLSDFGTNLSQGISSVITGSAIVIPWLIVLFALVWLLRKFWRRRKG